MQSSGSPLFHMDPIIHDGSNHLAIGTSYQHREECGQEQELNAAIGRLYNMTSKCNEGQGCLENHPHPQRGFKQFTDEDCKEAIYELGYIDRIPLNFRYKQGIEYVRTRLMHRYGDMNLNKAMGVFNDVLENGCASGLGDDDDIWRTWRHSYHHQHDDLSDPGTPRFPGMILPHPTPQMHRMTANYTQFQIVDLHLSSEIPGQDVYELGCRSACQAALNNVKSFSALPDVCSPPVESFAFATKKLDKWKAPTREKVVRRKVPRKADFEARVAQVHHSRDCTQELLGGGRSSSGTKVILAPQPETLFPTVKDKKSETAQQAMQHIDFNCGIGIFSKLRRSKKQNTYEKPPLKSMANFLNE